MRRGAALLLAFTAFTACTGGGSRPPAPAAPPEPYPTAVPTPAAVVQPSPGAPLAPTPETRAILAGAVTYLARVALTPEAVLQVELRDLSSPDPSAPPIAKQLIQSPGQVPIGFELSYEPSSLVPGHRYALSARISDRGQLQFVTESPVPAIPAAAPGPLEILVVPVQ